MKRIGPFIVALRERKASADTVLRLAVRDHIVTMLAEDPGVRAMIAKTGRSAAKDWIEDQAELERQAAWRCPVCGQHECDGPLVHGVLTDAEQNLANLEAHWANEPKGNPS